MPRATRGSSGASTLQRWICESLLDGTHGLELLGVQPLGMAWGMLAVNAGEDTHSARRGQGDQCGWALRSSSRQEDEARGLLIAERIRLKRRFRDVWVR